MIKTINSYPDMVDPQLRPRYTGVSTFFRCKLSEVLQDIDIGIIGVPYDGGVTNRTGARHGPRAVREQSTLIRRFNQATGVGPFESLSIADLGDVWLEKPFEHKDAFKEIEEFYTSIINSGTMPLSVGGDHSISLPILRALAKDGPLGMVHFDAHCDTGDDYLGSKFHHGSPFRRAVEEGLLDPKRVIQIGIRGSLNHRDMWSFSHESGMRVIYMEELMDKGWQWVVQEIIKTVGNGATYLTFDIDALDPVFAPGTGTPESGGMNTLESQRIIRALDEINFVGADLVEVSPVFDVTGVTALNAANLLFEILCVLAVSKQRINK